MDAAAAPGVAAVGAYVGGLAVAHVGGLAVAHGTTHETRSSTTMAHALAAVCSVWQMTSGTSAASKELCRPGPRHHRRHCR